jgi:hypothetical protein
MDGRRVSIGAMQNTSQQGAKLPSLTYKWLEWSPQRLKEREEEECRGNVGQALQERVACAKSEQGQGRVVMEVVELDIEGERLD